jgi:hypothetical protein
MRRRSHRRSLMIWTPPGGRTDGYGVPAFSRLPRTRLIRWWPRTAAQLAVIGVTRLARTMRARWRSMFLVAGALLVIIGVTLSTAWALAPGLVVLLVGLSHGPGRSHCRVADQMTGAHWHALGRRMPHP